MADPAFSVEHRQQFRELRAIGELHAINLSLEQLDFGPWLISCEIEDHDAADRLKNRFRAAVRKAAVAAGAPPRANLLDWWICKLAREGRPYLQGLIQRSIELCEEFEAASAEVAWKIRPSDGATGLRRDQYPTNFEVPYWLYNVPHETLPDPQDEFDYWKDHVWQGFWKLFQELEKNGLLWTDGSVHDARKRQPGETRLTFRNRIAARVSTRYERLQSALQCLGFDLAVLLANYVMDRRFARSDAMQTYDRDSVGLIEKMHACWKDCSRRLGLSWRKQLREANEVVDFRRAFDRVAADLKLLITQGNLTAMLASDPAQPPLAQPAPNLPVEPSSQPIRTEPAGTDSTSGLAPPDTEDTPRAKARSAWLDQKLAESGNWTSDKDIEANGGPVYNTIQRYRSGTQSTRDLYVRKRLAGTFNCSLSDVPE